MRVTLEIRSGPDAGRAIDVPPGSEVVVGRKAPAHFLIGSDASLSRAHFALSREGENCRIRDLGSTAGTLVDGGPVDSAEVGDGAVIEAGSTFLVVRFLPGDAPAPPDVPALAIPPAVRARPDQPTVEIEAIDPDTESPQDRALGVLRAQPEPLFAILDAARDPLVLVRLRDCPEQHQSLYEGMKGECMAASAPYLVALTPNSPFLATAVREGWGNSWGVYLTCREPFAEVRKHLRRFLTVKTEEGRELLFRYYDPRVLREFLPVCNPEEATRFFGPIREFILEGAGPGSIHRFPARAGGNRPRIDG